MIDFAQRDEYRALIGSLNGRGEAPAGVTTIASLIGHQLGALVWYSNWTRHNCEMSVYSWTPRAWGRKFLEAVFGYPFNQCGMRRVTAIVDEANTRSLRLVRGLGFVEEARMREFHGHRDGILFRMLTDECRWIEANYGQRRRCA